MVRNEMTRCWWWRRRHLSMSVCRFCWVWKLTVSVSAKRLLSRYQRTWGEGWLWFLDLVWIWQGPRLTKASGLGNLTSLDLLGRLLFSQCFTLFTLDMRPFKAVKFAWYGNDRRAEQNWVSAIFVIAIVIDMAWWHGCKIPKCSMLFWKMLSRQLAEHMN